MKGIVCPPPAGIPVLFVASQLTYLRRVSQIFFAPDVGAGCGSLLGHLLRLTS
jgi:hypothetical protein